ncbi:MAG: hypothetical protein JWQ87_585 [Candidatus Sulfotelmatobacter sp.]|nr:hypothetical protein [Candidatus Sulfotelmatobacter sp.]
MKLFPNKTRNSSGRRKQKFYPLPGCVLPTTILQHAELVLLRTPWVRALTIVVIVRGD